MAMLKFTGLSIRPRRLRQYVWATWIAFLPSMAYAHGPGAGLFILIVIGVMAAPVLFQLAGAWFVACFTLVPIGLGLHGLLNSKGIADVFFSLLLIAIGVVVLRYLFKEPVENGESTPPKPSGEIQ